MGALVGILVLFLESDDIRIVSLYSSSKILVLSVIKLAQIDCLGNGA
jgi:hypothetical protein